MELRDATVQRALVVRVVRVLAQGADGAFELVRQRYVCVICSRRGAARAEGSALG